MDHERWQRIQDHFEAAAELSADDRATYLSELADGDPDLLAEVESLLAADGESAAFLEQPALPGRISQILAQGPPRSVEGHIGPYRLLRKLGEGGMSSVFLAVRDDDEFQKLVAVKVIRHGLQSEDLLHRFRTERQILAGLDHPNIAKLLDGGSTENDLPYFVMDYIDGTPVDDYCDRNQLSVNKRLRLFLDICAAVQYAHQNLVVHRDLKASNILVTADGTPRLLDFGIAKLLKPEQFPVPVELTATRLRPMTPYYASPEQIQGNPITTASDVYSLGVLLYKLLTGHLPYVLASGSAQEVERVVVEEEPQRPSTAISRVETLPGRHGSDPVTVTPETVSAARGTQPPQLRRLLAGDLDTILLMALRKEPQRRYASVDQFAEDIRRSLAGLPVRAHKDSLGYRARKFVRRNWAPIGATTAFIALLAGLAVTMTVQAARISHERDQAQLERDRAEQVVAFLQEIFRLSDPNEGGGETITAREILDRGATRVTQELAGQPEIQATLLQAIGNVYRNLGLFELAEQLLREGLEIRLELFGEEHLAVAQSLNNLGIVLRQRGDYDSAEPLFDRALAVRRKQLPADHPQVAESLNNLALLYQDRGRLPEAERLFREAIAIYRAAPGISPVELSSLINNLAVLLTEIGDFAAAEPAFREALELRRSALGEPHALVAESLNDLGVFLGMQGDYVAAEPLLRDALAMRRLTLGDDHQTLGESLNNLGRLLREMGDYEAAEELYREGIEARRAAFGPDHRLVAIQLHNLAEVLQAQGKLAEAEAQFREGLAVRERLFGDSHQDVAISWKSLGAVLLERGQHRRAEPMLRRAEEIFDRTLPANHWRTAEARSLLGEALARQGQRSEAEPLLLASYETLVLRRGAGHRRTRDALERLVAFYESAGDLERADEFRRRMAS